jgi:hypothetical protein
MEDDRETINTTTTTEPVQEAEAHPLAPATEREPESHDSLEIEESEPAVEGKSDDEFGPNAKHYVRIPEPDPDRKPPPWFPKKCIPKMRFPKGLDIAFIKIKGTMTAAKQKGDRFIIVWELSDGDEKLAYGRAMGDVNRASNELAKGMVRAIDGTLVDWSGIGGAGNVDELWQDIGAKGRSQLQRLYTQLHVFDREEQEDFFENCIGLVRTG